MYLLIFEFLSPIGYYRVWYCLPLLSSRSLLITYFIYIIVDLLIPTS